MYLSSVAHRPTPAPTPAAVNPTSKVSDSFPVDEGARPEKTSAANKDQEHKSEPAFEATLARQLVEIQGNPAATARQAAEVRKAYTPPQKPYPSVGDLAIAARARQMEERALEALSHPESETTEEEA